MERTVLMCVDRAMSESGEDGFAAHGLLSSSGGGPRLRILGGGLQGRSLPKVPPPVPGGGAGG
eukprot:12036682-Heterocapsa_arctica.AAC.1